MKVVLSLLTRLCEDWAIGEVNSKISNLKSIEVIYVSLQDPVTLRNRTPVNQIQAVHQQAMDLNVIIS